jgi:hypothetical protein
MSILLGVEHLNKSNTNRSPTKQMYSFTKEERFKNKRLSE